MKCKETYDRIDAMMNGVLDEHEARQLAAHLDICDECRRAARADAALRALRRHSAAVRPPAGLFERVMRRSRLAGTEAPARSRFWFGVGVGAAVAASVLAVVTNTGMFESVPPVPTATPTFEVALGEPRNVNIAIEMEHDLRDAVITVVLTGGIELDGYAGRRELSWTTDLETGVNRLSLPVVAINETGGRLAVRVDHGGRERRFAMDLKLES